MGNVWHFHNDITFNLFDYARARASISCSMVRLTISSKIKPHSIYIYQFAASIQPKISAKKEFCAASIDIIKFDMPRVCPLDVQCFRGMSFCFHLIDFRRLFDCHSLCFVFDTTKERIILKHFANESEMHNCVNWLIFRATIFASFYIPLEKI